MAIEDYSSRKLKRFYFRSLRGAWRHERWVQNHSSWTTDYDYHRDMMKDYRVDVESARTELAHRSYYVG